MSVRNELSAGGVIFRRTAHGVDILLIQDHKGRWTFPKGHLKEGEDPADAAAREASEETGIQDLQVRGVVGDIHIIFRDKWGGTKDLIKKKITYYLLEALPNSQPNPPKDWQAGTEPIADAKWMPLAKALKKSGYKDNAKILKKTQELLDQPKQEALL